MDEAETLRGRHVVVVGGSSGVGLAVAMRAARHGAAVTLLARDPAKLGEAARLVRAARFIPFDLRAVDTIPMVARSLGAVDHLIICAGVYHAATLEASTVEDWRGVLDERLVGPLALIKALGPAIGSSIVMFSGTVARRPLPGSVWHSIVASGMESAVRALAVELAPLRVNAVAPGAVDTPMLARALGSQKDERLARLAATLPARRIGAAEDIADVVLLAMTNPFMTGTTIEIDGGAVLV